MNILYNERNVYGKGAYKLPLIHTHKHTWLTYQNKKETYDFTVVFVQLKHRPFDFRSNIYRTHIAIKSREEQENFAHLAFDCNIKMGSYSLLSSWQ